MQMKNSLSGSFAAVYPNIIGIWLKTLIQKNFTLF